MLLFALFLIIMWAYGIILAFSSHLITGVIVILLEPLPIIVGIGQIFGYDIAGSITEFITSF